MKQPTSAATEVELASFVRAWISLAAERGLESALRELDEMRVQTVWSQTLFDSLTFNHFGDGKQPRISDPVGVGDLCVEVYRYDDGSGFAVDHDLPMDGKRSDFTVQFSFKREGPNMAVYLEDIHVL